MKRYGRRRKAQEEAALDLTPMMDIVFIMLIFFIVTTSFVKALSVLSFFGRKPKKSNLFFLIIFKIL